jgi:phenylacetate-CoA ligase
MNWKTAALLGKYALYSPRALAVHAEALRNQAKSTDELEALNWSKRRALVAHAFRAVPHYARRFREAGFEPGDLRDPSDFERLPVLTKLDIRAHFDALKSSPERKARVSTTGGSTGVPLRVLHDAAFPVEVLVWRMLSWWGLGPGANAAYAWRSARPSLLNRAANAAMWWPTRRIRIDASSMSPADVDDFLRRFNRLRPELLQGYVGAVDHLAARVEAAGAPVWSPRAVWVTSSPVSAVQRARIERSFRAPVYDQYGCCEVFSLAAQCRERSRLHIYADYRHIEIVDDAWRPCPRGTTGQVLVTDLHNYAFPIIRYANGDRSRRVDGACACGMGLPLMDAVQGRVTDMIRLPDGTQLAGDYMTTIFDDFPEVVSAFQVRQMADHSIRILAVPNPSCANASEIVDKVCEIVAEKTKHQVRVAPEFVATIPHDRGKWRFVISELAATGSEGGAGQALETS